MMLVEINFNYLMKGELDYEIQPKDNILFISTLHGG